MLLTALTQMLRRLSSVLFIQLRFLLLRLALDQIEHAYIICGTATALYSLRMSCSQTPQVELLRLLSVCTVRVTFCLIISICSLYFSLVSRVKPRYLYVSVSFISPQSVLIDALTLIRLCNLIKQVSWNLSGAKTKACVVAYYCAFLSIVPSISHVCSVVLPYIRIATLLIYPIDIASVCLLYQLTRLALQRIQSRGESSKPCGMHVLITYSQDLNLLTRM